MKNIKSNKNKAFEENVAALASAVPPKGKAIIYVTVTVIMVLLFICQGILGIFHLEHIEKGSVLENLKVFHVIIPVLQGFLVTIQQKFNGANFKSVFSKDKK